MKFDCKACQVAARQSISLANWSKKPKGAESQTAQATVSALRVVAARFPTPGSTWTFLVTFALEDGRSLELSVFEQQYRALKTGVEGTLTWQRETMLSFEERT